MIQKHKHTNVIILLLITTSLVSAHTIKSPFIKKALEDSYKKSFTKLFNSKQSTLYKDYVAHHLKELSQKENECYYQKSIIDDNADCTECELLTEARLRLTAAYAHHESTGTVTTDNKTYQEIGVPRLIAQIPTTLTMGKAAFTATMCSPTTQESKITQAQEKQQFLENNELLVQELFDELQKALPGEKALLDMHNAGVRKRVKTALMPYRDIKTLPSDIGNSALARNIKVGTKQLIPLIAPLGLEFAISPTTKAIHHKIPYLNEKYTEDEVKNFFTVLQPMLFNIGIPFLKITFGSLDIYEHNYIDIFVGLSTLGFSILGVPNDDKIYIANRIAYGVAAIDCMRNGYAFYQQRSSEEETRLHQSLIDTANFMRSAEKIYTLMHKNPTLKSQFPDFCSTYEQVINGEKTKGIMYDLLQTNTFQGSPSPFSNPGRIAVTAERLIKEKEQFIPLMKAMGGLDTYIALIQYKKTVSHMKQ